MVIGDAARNAQPKNGIDSSSFLATKASGGHTKFSASVSQVDECLRHDDMRLVEGRQVLAADDALADAADPARAEQHRASTSP